MKRVLPFLSLFIVTVIAMLFAHFSVPSVYQWELRTPHNGNWQDQVVVRFSRPMDRSSVEERWRVTPQIAGSLSWTEGTLFFTPEEPLPRGQDVTFTLEAGAKDVYGRALRAKQEHTVSFPPSSVVFISTDGQLTYGELYGNFTTLTERETITDVAVGNEPDVVWYLKQPSPEAATELWRVNVRTKLKTQRSLEVAAKLSNLSIGKDNEAYVLGQPLEPTEGVATPYRIDLGTGTTQTLVFGGVEANMVSLSLADDLSTLVASDVDSVQHLRSTVEDKVVSLTKLSLYRGSDRAARTLVFEDIVPDKNYASEIVVYDGAQKRLPLVDANGSMPDLSPGGSLVAYSFQGTSPLNQLEVLAGESLLASLTLPVYGLRVQALGSETPLWEKKEEGTSFELAKFSPDGRFIAVESFSAAQLRDLRSIREHGEPNKPIYGRIRFLNAKTGEFHATEFLGREVIWLP